MKPARLIVLGVALAAGGVAAYLANGIRQPEAPKGPPPPPPLATVDVLVAKSNLDTGQVVAAKDVGWQTWPAASAGANFIRKPDRPDAIKDFVGAIVRTSVMAGEPIRDSKVVAGKGGGFMAAMLPHGMRAVAIDVQPDTGAGGFILPNDHVDIVLTRRDKAAEKVTGVERFISETVLRNVRVLAVDQNVEDKEGQKVVIGKTATVELDPHQAETLALSRQLGTLSLTLRSLLDSQSATPEGGNDDDRSKPVNTVRYGVSTQSAIH
ncbi:MAG: Flp pilus assembly protein CpaB [Hyphomicrobiales bacterium]|nr:Flp pilus assembly protein CpaB [Hyphomicrobiales bacterium]